MLTMVALAQIAAGFRKDISTIPDWKTLVEIIYILDDTFRIKPLDVSVLNI